MFVSIEGLVQWMHNWIGLGQRGDQSDQHLKQDNRNYVEDLQKMLEVRVTK
jgi:hypothetical protein